MNCLENLILNNQIEIGIGNLLHTRIVDQDGISNLDILVHIAWML
jgi:hypothetical protein